MDAKVDPIISEVNLRRVHANEESHVPVQRTGHELHQAVLGEGGAGEAGPGAAVLRQLLPDGPHLVMDANRLAELVLIAGGGLRAEVVLVGGPVRVDAVVGGADANLPAEDGPIGEQLVDSVGEGHGENLGAQRLHEDARVLG